MPYHMPRSILILGFYYSSTGYGFVRKLIVHETDQLINVQLMSNINFGYFGGRLPAYWTSVPDINDYRFIFRISGLPGLDFF